MLKTSNSMKSIEDRAAEVLRDLLEQVPAIRIVNLEQEAQEPDGGVDIIAEVEVSGQRHVLVCEVKASGQPRHVRMALLRLRNYMAHHAPGGIPVFIAPVLSPRVQALCHEHGVCFLDFEGNARLLFDTVYIERQVASKPVVERRELKSLFKPKSAQVLRVMLRVPSRAWRVTELAEMADISLGHVSNVRASLLDREWGEVSDAGLFLSDPNALLDAWRDVYETPPGQCIKGYTTLHGSAFEETARRVLSSDPDLGRAAFASFSAANWLAPYGRTGTHYIYVDNEIALDRLQSNLNLSEVSKGENVLVTLLKDSDLLRDTVEPAPGAICTSLVQTYLDLTTAGERGREAADHLRRERLIWPK